jgi:hypothetical protein
VGDALGVKPFGKTTTLNSKCRTRNGWNADSYPPPPTGGLRPTRLQLCSLTRTAKRLVPTLRYGSHGRRRRNLEIASGSCNHTRPSLLKKVLSTCPLANQHTLTTLECDIPFSSCLSLPPPAFHIFFAHSISVSLSRSPARYLNLH